MTDYDPVQKENVLLVDDTPANLEILIKMLQREGYKVRAVNSGMMALNAAGLEAPDIFLLDVNMPGMNGYETCRKLKESERFRSIPVIFISALSEVFDKVAAFESGGVDFITKPFQFEEVIARVRTHLELRRYQNLLEQKNKELKEALDRLNETQGQLINSEKMASLGVLTAGIAHEFNNPISFIHTSSLGLGNDVKFFLGMQQRYEEILTRCDPAALEELRQIKSEEE